MKKSKEGYLLTDIEGEWYFKSGQSRKSKLLVFQLPNFTVIIDTLVEYKQLFQGWITSQN